MRVPKKYLAAIDALLSDPKAKKAMRAACEEALVYGYCSTEDLRDIVLKQAAKHGLFAEADAS